jgi:hypothetical protein
VRFRLCVFAARVQKCLLTSGLRTRKFACREILARLHGQQQQIETKNKAENFHWIRLKSYYKTFVSISQKKMTIKRMRLTKRNAENFSQRRKAFMQQLKPREIYATKDGLREVQYISKAERFGFTFALFLIALIYYSNFFKSVTLV